MPGTAAMPRIVLSGSSIVGAGVAGMIGVDACVALGGICAIPFQDVATACVALGGICAIPFQDVATACVTLCRVTIQPRFLSEPLKEGSILSCFQDILEGEE